MSSLHQTSPTRRTVVAGLASAFAIGPFISSASSAANLAKRFSAAGSATMDHSAWTAILGQYVKPAESGLNRFDYAGLKAKDQDALHAYLAELQQTDVTTLTRDEQFAFWANLYNAQTVDVIVQHYPVASIKDIDISPGWFADGPWGKKMLKVTGVDLSLDDIEHKIMRPGFGDPRAHYAVNCASVGCPNLQQVAFTGVDLNTTLDKAAREYINNPRGVRVAGGRITASKIYKWFKEDFGGNAAGVIAHALKYADADLAGELEGKTSIASYEYDWKLNGASTSS